jgi:signal transduction histidine kinase
MDRQRLVRVFQNLVKNGVQHSPPGGAVTLAATVRGAVVACEVRDEGAGIPAEHLPRLFEPFFTKRRGGTGLGLSIVERIVREHDGAVTAGSAPGGGALTTVRLPVAPAPAPVTCEDS